MYESFLYMSFSYNSEHLKYEIANSLYRTVLPSQCPLTDLFIQADCS